MLIQYWCYVCWHSWCAMCIVQCTHRCTLVVCSWGHTMAIVYSFMYVTLARNALIEKCIAYKALKTAKRKRFFLCKNNRKLHVQSIQQLQCIKDAFDKRFVWESIKFIKPTNACSTWAAIWKIHAIYYLWPFSYIFFVLLCFGATQIWLTVWSNLGNCFSKEKCAKIVKREWMNMFGSWAMTKTD